MKKNKRVKQGIRMFLMFGRVNARSEVLVQWKVLIIHDVSRWAIKSFSITSGLIMKKHKTFQFPIRED